MNHQKINEYIIENMDVLMFLSQFTRDKLKELLITVSIEYHPEILAEYKNTLRKIYTKHIIISLNVNTEEVYIVLEDYYSTELFN